MVTLETERLLIRDNIKEDLFKHHLLMSDPEVMYYIQDIQCYSLEDSQENLEFSLEESKKGKERTCYFFAIIEKKSKSYVGSIGFTVTEKNSKGGIGALGYFILKDYWHKGYTTEAVRKVIEVAFDEVGLHKITTGCIYENTYSEKIMIKCGFKKEAHFTKHVFHQGQWKDRVEYGLIKP